MFNTPTARILFAAVNAAAVVAVFMVLEQGIGDGPKPAQSILSRQLADPITTGSTHIFAPADWRLRGTLE